MDPRTSGVESSTNAAKQAAEIEREIEDIRGNLDHLVSELGERRHRLSPVRVVREHPAIAMVAGALLLAGLVTGGTFIHRARARKQRSWFTRGRRWSSALPRLVAAQPVEKVPGAGWKILTAAGTAAAAVAARRLARRMFRPGDRRFRSRWR